MNRACLQGLEQIITKQCDTKLKREGCQDVISYGIAFSGKYCAERPKRQMKAPVLKRYQARWLVVA